MAEQTLIQFRRGLASQWTTANPILSAGTLGVETDTLKVKVGNGTTAWNALQYLNGAELAGKADVGHTHTATEISNSTATGRSLITATDAAAARTAIGAGTSSLVLGTSAGTAKAGDWFPSFAEVTGTLGTAQLPPLAINETFVVATQAAMLALTAQRGDIAIRTDTSETYVLATDSPGTLADWKEIIANGQVVSVAGRTGAIVLTKSDVGLANVDNTADSAKPVSTAQQTALNAKENTITAGTTAQYWRGDKTWQTLNSTAVGLGSVNNTSDAAKPVSTAQQAALDLKAPIANPTFTGTVSGVTKTHVGLSNVDNTSDANKPISTAVSTALAGKAASTHTHVAADIISIDGGTP